MADFTIETYWNVETLYYVFNAVAAMMGGVGFSGLLKTVFLFSLGLGMFSYVAGKQLEMAQWFVQALIFTTLLNMPIARVTFVDKTNLQPPRVVANVPFAMALVGQMVNMTFGFITSQYETAFQIPEELGLAQGDVGFGHRILKQINHAEIQDPGLRADLFQFFKECTLYDIKDGQITPQQIVGGTNVWQEIFTNTTPARFVTYDTLTPMPVTDTCQNAALILKDRVNNAATSAQTFYGKQAFPLAQSDALATSMFMNATGASYDWILQSSQNSADAMRQAMFNNIWRQAGTTLPAMLNDPAQVTEVSALMGEAQAAAQANGSNSVLSLLGQETLPHMRNWLEAILYALFPVVAILMIVSSADGAKKILVGYMMSLAWIGLWPVLFAVINHLSLMYLKHKANALSLIAGVPFQLSDVFDSTLINEQAQIGYLVVLVPFIASAIVRLGQGGFMSIADQAISGFNSNGALAGAANASGNVSMGQVGLDTQVVNTTTMFKMDYGLALQGGGATIGTASGGVARMASDGSAAFEQMNNRFIASMATESNLNSLRQEEAYSTYSAGKGHSVSNRANDSTSLNTVTGHEQTRGNSQYKSVDVSSRREGSIGNLSEQGQSLNILNSDSASFQTSAGAADNLKMGLSASADSIKKNENIESAGANGQTQGPSKNTGGNTPQLRKPSFSSKSRESNPVGNSSPVDNTSGNSKKHFTAQFGFDSSKTYSAVHGRTKGHTLNHSRDESAKNTIGFQESASRDVRENGSQQSAQINRQGTDAVLSNFNEHSSGSDVFDRSERGTGNRASRNESDLFSFKHDLLNDVDFMKQVANRNGLSAMRFYSQETPTILEQARSFAEEQGVMSSAGKLKNTAFNGEYLPSSSKDVQSQYEKDRKKVANDIENKHLQNINQTQFEGVQKIDVNLNEPRIIHENQALIGGKLNSKNPQSMQQKSAAFDENVEAWASFDKPVGQGRANPMAVVEATEKRDAKDYLDKVIDSVSGGDGTAGGEKLNENKKREDSPGF